MGHDACHVLFIRICVLLINMELLRAAQNREELALSRLADLISHERNLGRVCLSLFEIFENIIPFDRIGIALIKEDQVTARWVKSKFGNSSLPVNYTASLRGSSLKKIIETGKPRILNDLEEYFLEHSTSDSTRRILADGIRSSLTCPLKSQGRVLGFMFFSSGNKNTYENSHSEVYQLIASQLAFLFEILEQEEVLSSFNTKDKYFHHRLHEIGNGLNFVNLSIQLILRGSHGHIEDKVRRAIEALDIKLQETLGLFDEMRNYNDAISADFSIQRNDLELISFLKTFDSVARVLCEKKQINFTLKLAPMLPTLLTIDGKRISQVLMNLLSNSIKFSLPNSQVILKVSLSEKQVQFMMQDQGQGISTFEQNKVFLEKSHISNMPTYHEHSSGLGLFICKRIIEDHGGKIWFKSEFGVGSQFFFSLPIPETH